MSNPNPYAIVVNNQTSPKATNKSLSGCGVTFKVCQAIDYINNTSYANDLISFVHITNISDSCKFVHPEQQTFRYWGLQSIYPTLQPFIDAFNYKGGLDNKSFSFGIISRFNAVIRVGTLEQKKTLFLALALGRDIDKAIEICKKCKTEQDKTRDEIIENGLTLTYNGQINIYETDTPTSLTGLIANKLQDRDNRTVFVVHNFNGEVKGSCRSPYDEEDVNIRQLCDQSNEFNYASGHSSAFGVSWDSLNGQEVCSWIWSLTLSEPNIATLGSWTAKSIPKYLFSEFGANASLYGQGMKEPLVHIHSITVNQGDIREMGANGRTLKLSKDGIDFMWFMISNEDKKALLNTPYELELVGTMGVNEWNGRKTPQIIVEKYEISDLKKKTLEDIF
jgi:single-stranded-DNA-specific exonuclease